MSQMSNLHATIIENIEQVFGSSENALLEYARTLVDRELLTPEFAVRINQRIAFLRSEKAA